MRRKQGEKTQTKQKNPPKPNPEKLNTKGLKHTPSPSRSPRLSPEAFSGGAAPSSRTPPSSRGDFEVCFSDPKREGSVLR